MVREKYGYSSLFQIQELSTPLNGGPWQTIYASLLKNLKLVIFSSQRYKGKWVMESLLFFWHDLWVGPCPLQQAFPHLFLISSNPNDTISSFGYWAESKWQWNFDGQRSLRPRDVSYLANLPYTVRDFCLLIDNDDIFVWLPSKSGNFSVKSIRKNQQNHPLN